MQKLTDVMANPSGFDSMKNYAGEIPAENWCVVMTRNRDSDILTESNWESALEMLGGESDSVQIFRFGHWACGWWEALCVLENSPAQRIGEEIEERIESYPVLDEDDFSRREMDEANQVWESCYRWKERIEWIRRHRSQFEFRDLADLLAQVRGKYFGGCASDLVR